MNDAQDFRLISYDHRNALLDPQRTITAVQLEELAPRLEAARQEVAETDVALLGGKGGPIPPEKDPLDAGFYMLPETLLDEYRKKRGRSELGKILAAAKRLRGKVDRVVVLGIGGSYMGARALLEACCHPYHNELSRAERNNIPRIYFEGNNVDNDASQGLLDLLGRGRPAKGRKDRWGIVVISKSGSTLETSVAFRQFYRALLESCGGDAKAAAALTLVVTGEKGQLFDLARARGIAQVFPFSPAVGGRFSVLSAVGLLPAAIMGLDVVKLLEGAAAMNEHFRTAPVQENVVLQAVGVSHLLEVQRGMTIRVLSAWAKGLEAVGLWYDQLLAESLGKAECGATPLTAVNTRDLHSRGQQHQEGRRDKFITNLVLRSWRREPLPVGESAYNEDDLNRLATKTLPQIMEAAIAGTNAAYRGANRPTADLILPAKDEATLGQLFQLLMLATVVEGRLIGINPYGQPGVEEYKKHMRKNLEPGGAPQPESCD